MTMNESTYSDRLRDLMAERKVSKSDLARALGITYQAAKKAVELGGKFGAENNSKAAQLLGVDPNWLLNGGPRLESGDRVAVSVKDAIAVLDRHLGTLTPGKQLVARDALARWVKQEISTEDIQDVLGSMV